MKRRLEITPSLCIGCKTCELSCSFFHAKDKNNLAKSRIVVIKTSETSYFPYTCLQCVEPGCVKACLVDALKRNDKTGAIDHDEEKCISCMACVTACPFGNIIVDTLARSVVKCDLCGGDPMCAKFCPSKALRFGEAKTEKGEESVYVVG